MKVRADGFEFEFPGALEAFVFDEKNRSATPEKPVHYLCVLTLDNGLLGVVNKELNQALPCRPTGPRWQRPLAQACVVLNPERWHSAFPAWPLRRY